MSYNKNDPMDKHRNKIISKEITTIIENNKRSWCYSRIPVQWHFFHSFSLSLSKKVSKNFIEAATNTSRVRNCELNMAKKENETENVNSVHIEKWMNENYLLNWTRDTNSHMSNSTSIINNTTTQLIFEICMVETFYQRKAHC